jgi:tetratricopeptide (TPR) repeat protein
MDPHEVEQHIIETWDFDDATTSYDAFTAASAAAGPESAEGLVLRTQVARAQGLRRELTESGATLDAVASDLDRLAAGLTDQQTSHVRARLAIERGRVRNASGSPADARPYFETAHDEATKAGLAGLAVDALHMTAIAAGATEGSTAAAAVNAQAIAVAESSDDPAARRWLGSLLNNYGWDRHDAGAYAEALDIFRRAVEVRLEYGTPREVAIARWCVGRCLRSLERYSEALEVQETLAASAAANDGYVYEELGENLMALGRGDEAATYFSRAHELLSEDDWLADNESERLERLLTLSED